MAMSSFDTLLVIANRILAREDVVDAYGPVSVRHPDNPRRFLIARSVATELVTTEDIVELDLDGQPVRDEKRTLYLERFIHAAIFAARPDVTAVVHAHAEDTLAFGVANATKLRPVIHSGSFIGTEVSGTSPTISATPTCSSRIWSKAATSQNASVRITWR
jgi:HCOMODA/2-hydroxy-3-carboxy-muconic semialdehyde decarboxylase